MISRSMEELFEKGEALKGVRILDITRIILGPWASTFFVEVGADNELVYLDLLGFTKKKLDGLKKDGVI